MNTDFLQDKDFLKKLDNLRIKEQYIRLTILSWNEEPIVEIQGKAISGSLNLDGSSSLRRTASFSMFAEERENDLSKIDQTLAINRKAKLEIGFLNTVPNYYYTVEDEAHNKHIFEVNYQKQYGDIVWFPLGVFVLFSPNLQHQNTGVQINLQLKDKMCLLNGDVGGVLPAAVTFSEMEDEYGEITHPTLNQIIQELVNHFGKEDAAKIIISDLDDTVKQVMKYNGNSPIYYIEHTENETTTRKFFFNWENAKDYADSLNISTRDIRTFEYGNDIGYVLTSFTYPGDLTSNPGDTITSILDKIIQVVGNYEYFYDVYGYFHFQEIKNYLNTTYTTTILKEINANPNYEVDFSSGESVYTFDGTQLITSISNSPQYNNVKNDFMVWGVRRQEGTDIETPIRYHLAIDHKPEPGQTHKVHFYTDQFGVVRAAADFMIEVVSLPTVGKKNTIYVVGSLNNTKYYMWDEISQSWNQITLEEREVTTVDWREELYYEGIEALETGNETPYYFEEMRNEWPKLFNLQTQNFYDSIKEDPSSIDFWIDMVDDASEVGQYNVDNIGRRSIVVQEDKINCVFEQDVPDIVFIDITQSKDDIEAEKEECDKEGQDWIQVDDTTYSMLAAGGNQNSCFQRINELLYQYTNMNETIQVSALPIYYLEPNTRITVRDDATGINGDYMMKSISLPLDINSLMSITAYRCAQKL